MPEEDVLDHPRRRQIYEAIREEPGLNWSQLQRRVGFGVGTLMFHLRRLESEDVLVRKPSTNDNEVLFFASEDEALWRDPRTRVLFGNDSTRRIAELLAEASSSSAKEIAEELGVTPAAVRYHINKLEDRQLVHRERDGRQVLYRADGQLSDWMQRVR